MTEFHKDFVKNGKIRLFGKGALIGAVFMSAGLVNANAQEQQKTVVVSKIKQVHQIPLQFIPQPKTTLDNLTNDALYAQSRGDAQGILEAMKKSIEELQKEEQKLTKNYKLFVKKNGCTDIAIKHLVRYCYFYNRGFLSNRKYPMQLAESNLEKAKYYDKLVVYYGLENKNSDPIIQKNEKGLYPTTTEIRQKLSGPNRVFLDTVRKQVFQAMYNQTSKRVNSILQSCLDYFEKNNMVLSPEAVNYVYGSVPQSQLKEQPASNEVVLPVIQQGAER